MSTDRRSGSRSRSPPGALAGRAAPLNLSAAFAGGKTEDCEQCAAFDPQHYPNGLNSNFLLGDPAEVVASNVRKFETPEIRDLARAVPDILAMLKTDAGLNERSVVADVGAGTGLFTFPLAGIVSKVFAQELSPVFVTHLEKRAREAEVRNVVVVQGDERDPKLPIGEVDIVIVMDVYHHFEYPRTVCEHLRACLRPKGRLMVVDFIRDEAVHKSHAAGWITAHVRAGQEVFRKEIESAGFVHVAEPQIPTLSENYCMIFENPGQTEPVALRRKTVLIRGSCIKMMQGAKMHFEKELGCCVDTVADDSEMVALASSKNYDALMFPPGLMAMADRGEYDLPAACASVKAVAPSIRIVEARDDAPGTPEQRRRTAALLAQVLSSE